MNRRNSIILIIILALPITAFLLWKKQEGKTAATARPKDGSHSTPAKELPKEKEEEKKLPAEASSTPEEKKPVIKARPSEGKAKTFYEGREVVDTGAADKSKQIEDYEFVNEINPAWRARLLTQLKKFQPAGTKVDIAVKNSLLEIFDTKARYIEVVTVTTAMPTGQTLSYNANVDPSDGKILDTWNRTLIETPNPRGKEGLAPSGSLKRKRASAAATSED